MAAVACPEPGPRDGCKRAMITVDGPEIWRNQRRNAVKHTMKFMRNQENRKTSEIGH